MTKLAEITEKIIRDVGGTKDNTDGKIDYLWIEANVPRWRQEAIEQVIAGSKVRGGNDFIPSQLYQRFTVTIDKSIQNTAYSYSIATIPAAVRIKQWFDGSLFLGDKKTMRGFSQIASPSYASDLVKRGDLNKNNIGYLETGPEIKLFGDKDLVDFYVERVCANPASVPDFDIDIHEYPVDELTELVLCQIARAELVPTTSKPADTVNDAVETLERRPNKANQV